MDQVTLTPLKQIGHPKGDIFHALKGSESDFSVFGEAYFSFVKCGEIKGWKKHSAMVLNIVVPVGAIEFVIFDDRDNSSSKGEFMTVTLSPDNYQRLTVPPGVWVAFRGKSEPESLLLNIASIEHDPNEAVNLPIESFNYHWS